MYQYKCTIDNTTGFLIEGQSADADDDVLLANAKAVGFLDVSIIIATEAEHLALINQRDAVKAAP